MLILPPRNGEVKRIGARKRHAAIALIFNSRVSNTVPPGVRALVFGGCKRQGSVKNGIFSFAPLSEACRNYFIGFKRSHPDRIDPAEPKTGVRIETWLGEVILARG